MKFRMAENSLFAVLLRSPWWISMLVTAAFVGVTQSLLPQEYRNIGSLGALPFFVIGCIAFWRQLRAPSAGERQAILDRAAGMAWPEFEKALRAGFAREGWDVRAAQGGADLLLERIGEAPKLVSARRWKAARHGEDTVQALEKALRQHDGARGVYVALGELTPQASRLAKERGIEVMAPDALVKLLRG